MASIGGEEAQGCKACLWLASRLNRDLRRLLTICSSSGASADDSAYSAMMGGTASQDQPHAHPLSAVRGHHGAHPPVDWRRVAPQGARCGAAVRVRGHSAAGIRHSGGALRVVSLSVNQGPGCQRQGCGRG